ncbi:GNAT family N-acetyltransferase [Streptomyces sp. NPDC058657]|uniref:GNAT family N-acetyltransferase n=1 Tax=unclassified Streptomyces TaxID=2593676 RepID=UPI0036571890
MTATTHEDILIRPAQLHEHSEVGDLTALAYLTDGHLTFGEEDPYLSVLRDARSRAEGAELLVAADTAGTLLGTVTYAPHGSPLQDIGVPGEAEFRMLAVSPRARGRGVGMRLVRACIARAQAEEGVVRVVMSTSPTMLGAHRIYRRLGFVRTPQRDWDPVPGLTLLTYKLELQTTSDPLPLVKDRHTRH